MGNYVNAYVFFYVVSLMSYHSVNFYIVVNAICKQMLNKCPFNFFFIPLSLIVILFLWNCANYDQ